MKSGFIDFTVDEVDPAVRTLVRDVGERVGEKRLDPKERKRKAKAREKELSRQRRGLVRIHLEMHPAVKAKLEEMAVELGVPVSQVVNELLVEMITAKAPSTLSELSEKREVCDGRRFSYFIPYRGTPINSEGHPSKKVRGTP